MSDDIRNIQNEFNAIANTIMQATYDEFRNDTAMIDRDGDENVYQMLRSKYCHELRQLLEYKASVLMRRCESHKQQSGLGANLANTIRYFEDQFMRKADEA